MEAPEADPSASLPGAPSCSSAVASAEPAPVAEAAASAPEAAGEANWVRDVLKKQQWESAGQHAERVKFLQRVLQVSGGFRSPCGLLSLA